MRWLPRTLFGQNLLLLGALIVLAQLLSALLFFLLVQKPRIHALAQHTHAYVTIIEQALKVLPPSARGAYLEGLIASGALVGVADKPPPSDPPTWADRVIQETLATVPQSTSPKRLQAWQNQPQRVLWVRLVVDSQTYWLGLSAKGLLTDTTNTVVALSLVSLVLALTGAWLVQRHINRPLRLLVGAAKEWDHDDQPIHMPWHAPSEIVAVAEGLHQRNQSLAQFNRERELLFAGISHDLRTPLTKMRLALEMGNWQGTDTELVESMVRQTERMDSIIGQFIDYARVGANEEPCEIDLNTLLEQVAPDRRVERGAVRLELAPLPLMWLRPISMQRLVDNLLGNARKYGGGEVTLSTRLLAEGGVELRVSDGGPGVPPQEMERLRQPFQRSHTTTAGSGLGLAIVDRVVRLHHGSWSMNNRAGGGLEVVVRIPARS